MEIFKESFLYNLHWQNAKWFTFWQWQYSRCHQIISPNPLRLGFFSFADDCSVLFKYALVMRFINVAYCLFPLKYRAKHFTKSLPKPSIFNISWLHAPHWILKVKPIQNMPSNLFPQTCVFLWNIFIKILIRSGLQKLIKATSYNCS